MQEADIVEVNAEVDVPVAKGNMQARAVTVRSKLGEELYQCIQKDLKSFYEAVRNAALGDLEDPFLPKDRKGNPARSAGAYLAAHRKMFIDLMKMANADVDVSQANFSGDIDIFKEQLKSLSTSELKDLVGAASNTDKAYD